MRHWAIALAGMLAATGTANAGERDLHAASAISAGDFARAEAILTKERTGRWTAPETLLNLAHVYRHTGRAESARGLYDQVLSDSNVLLNVGSDRPLWSHDLARAGIAQLGSATTIAAR